jgi:hypothetical protein
MHSTRKQRNVASAVGLAGHVERLALELGEVLKERSGEEGDVDRSVLGRALNDKTDTDSRSASLPYLSIIRSV